GPGCPAALHCSRGAGVPGRYPQILSPCGTPAAGLRMNRVAAGSRFARERRSSGARRRHRPRGGCAMDMRLMEKPAKDLTNAEAFEVMMYLYETAEIKLPDGVQRDLR